MSKEIDSTGNELKLLSSKTFTVKMILIFIFDNNMTDNFCSDRFCSVDWGKK